MCLAEAHIVSVEILAHTYLDRQFSSIEKHDETDRDVFAVPSKPARGSVVPRDMENLRLESCRNLGYSDTSTFLRAGRSSDSRSDSR